jgi:hypothetical protein
MPARNDPLVERHLHWNIPRLSKNWGDVVEKNARFSNHVIGGNSRLRLTEGVHVQQRLVPLTRECPKRDRKNDGSENACHQQGGGMRGRGNWEFLAQGMPSSRSTCRLASPQSQGAPSFQGSIKICTGKKAGAERFWAADAGKEFIEPARANHPEQTNRSEAVEVLEPPPPRHQHRKYPPPQAPPRPLGFIPIFLRILECQLASETSLRPPSGRWFYVECSGHAPREFVFAQPRSAPPPPSSCSQPTVSDDRGPSSPPQFARQRWWGRAARVSAVGVVTRTSTKVVPTAATRRTKICCVRSVPFIPTFLRMLECLLVRCCPLCIRSAVGFFGGGFAKTESAAPQKSDGWAIHPPIIFEGRCRAMAYEKRLQPRSAAGTAPATRRRPTTNQVYSNIRENDRMTRRWRAMRRMRRGRRTARRSIPCFRQALPRNGGPADPLPN